MRVTTPRITPAGRVIAVEDLGRLGVLLAIAAVLALSNDAFPTAANLLNVLRQASLLFIVAAGLTLVLLTGGIDLSVAANLSLSGCLAATVLKASGSALLGVATACAAGTAVGLANGVAIAWLGMPPFIVTYGMMWVVQGIAYSFMGGTSIYGFPADFRLIGVGTVAGLPVPILMMVGFLGMGAVITNRTILGRDIYAIGANRQAAQLSGIPIARRLLLVYVLCGLLAGIASLIYLARVNSAEPGIGEPLLLPALAAVLMGGTSLFGGVGTLTGTLVGSLILTLVINGMNLNSVDASWQPLVMGVIMLATILVDRLARGRAGTDKR
jgi:ribose transport system permease protein